MMRSLLLVCVTASVAHADMGTLPNNASVTFDGRLWIHENNSQDLVLPSMIPLSVQHYFNMAHCVCGQPGASVNMTYNQFTFAQEVMSTSGGNPLAHFPGEIWVGTGCDGDPTTRNLQCHQITSAGISDLSTIAAVSVVKPEVPVFDMLNPEPMNQGCQERVLSATEWVMSQLGTGMYSWSISSAISTDTQAPPQPMTFHVSGAESAVQLSWDAPQGNIADIAYYQALCADELDQPATPNAFSAKYDSPYQLCGVQQFMNFQYVDIGTGMASMRLAPPAAVDAAIDAPVDAAPMIDAAVGDDAGGNTINLPDGFSQMDPAFICGEVDDATLTSMRIQNLKDGHNYKIALLTIDLSGNVAGTFFTSLVQPKPVTDFWQDLHNRGSQVDGGFCLIAETYGDHNPLTNALRRFRDNTLGETVLGRALVHAYYAASAKLGAIVHAWWPLRIVAGILLLPLVAFALLWHVLTLPGLVALVALAVLARRHRRVRRLLAPATLALLWLAPAAARAQSPYWEDQTQMPESTSTPPLIEPDIVTWHAGIRLGPYTPAIDAQLGKTPGPYAAMFGKSPAWVPMLDVDHTIWRGIGMLMVGGSVGFMSRTAHAWAICMDPADFSCSPDNPNRMRSPGDKTSFKLLPLAATVTYRFSYLDDEYGVPIVPYAKGGLDYYVWWSTDPNGNFSNVMGNKAAGASLGVQGTVGLSIRAERIDADAARSMRDSGINHAGFYGEFTAAWVNGFGSSHKLSVGDNTWFAGVEFEF